MNRWPKPEPQSALVVLVPAAEELVARFRAAHDPAAAAGMPAHITTLFPFRPPVRIDVMTIEQLKACFSAYEPFDFELVGIKRFPGLIYLAPEPDDRLKTLTQAALEAFPDYPPYEGKHSDIIPHLTVAQEEDEQVLGRIGLDFGVTAERFLPLAAKATEVALMDNSSGPWRVVTTFTLGRLWGSVPGPKSAVRVSPGQLLRARSVPPAPRRPEPRQEAPRPPLGFFSAASCASCA
jgi:2'-5' RNA ligase superfamily